MKALWRHWWWVGLALVMAAGLSRVRFEAEVLELLPGDIPAVHQLQRYQRHFANVRELVLTVRGPDAEAAETAARMLAESLRRQPALVAAAMWQPPWLDPAGQVAEFIAWLWLNQPPEAFAQWAGRMKPERVPEQLNAAREQLATSLSPQDIAQLSYDPFGFTRLPESVMGAGGMSLASQQNWFATADGRFRAVFVEPHGELRNYKACAAWLERVRAAVARCAGEPGWPGQITVRFTGGPPLTAEIASGMESDFKQSAVGTLVLIAGLFWWAHRRWFPLVWLMAVLLLVVAGTMAIGGLVFTRLNAVSLGFTAILMGLAIDYGLVLYAEHLAHPGVSAAALRKDLSAGIGWSAVTTACAFGVLNFSGLPGLSQLGSLVAIGILLAAALMLRVFLPVILQSERRRPVAVSLSAKVCPGGGPSPLRFWLVATLLLVVTAAAAVWWKTPQIDHSTKPLQPRHSPAQEALDELQTELNGGSEPLLALISGRDETEVARRLEQASRLFAAGITNRQLTGVLLPLAVWPRPEFQAANRPLAGRLAAQADGLRQAARQAGFSDQALTLADTVLGSWRQSVATNSTVWPTDSAGRWLARRMAAWTGQEWLALGLLYPAPGRAPEIVQGPWQYAQPGLGITGWSVLGEVLLQRVEHRLVWLAALILTVVVSCLWLAFRRFGEVLLSFGTLACAFLFLLAVMGLAGWQWNLMNLTVLPLFLGAGVDYTIHVQIALRRHGGDIAAMRRITGRALFLCAATTVVGFGSLGMSSNAGLASLGWVCATGILSVYLSALFLLPAWWLAVYRHAAGSTVGGVIAPVLPERPSALYGPKLWRAALAMTRTLPAGVLDALCRGLAEVYYRLNSTRRVVVVNNLLPVLGGDRAAAERTAHRLFQQFGLKLADLWRFESGLPFDRWQNETRHWDYFAAAQARGRGVLMITPHLGNWEMGAPLLADRGVKLLVITQAEPGSGFTDLRRSSRARWGIETLVIREDAFAFLEVIRRLQEGATVALLLDRPPQPSAVTVELFGRPFCASVAAAELARATGCALLGVCIVRTAQGYVAQLLPEFTYDRKDLGGRPARRALTQHIMRAFEPWIRQHADQWYHFVPIWPPADPPDQS